MYKNLLLFMLFAFSFSAVGDEFMGWGGTRQGDRALRCSCSAHVGKINASSATDYLGLVSECASVIGSYDDRNASINIPDYPCTGLCSCNIEYRLVVPVYSDTPEAVQKSMDAADETCQVVSSPSFWDSLLGNDRELTYTVYNCIYMVSTGTSASGIQRFCSVGRDNTGKVNIACRQ